MRQRRGVMLLAMAMVGWATAAWAQPTGLPVTSFLSSPGCAQPSQANTSNFIDYDFQDRFGVRPNEGRIHCRLQLQVNVPANYQFTFDEIKLSYAPPVPLNAAEVYFSGRLNGTVSKALVDLSWTIPADTPVTLSQSFTYAGGPVTWGLWPIYSASALVFPAGTTLQYSACATQATTRSLVITIEIAAASNYVIPWPPPPADQNEKFNLIALRLGTKWRPCPVKSLNNPDK